MIVPRQRGLCETRILHRPRQGQRLTGNCRAGHSYAHHLQIRIGLERGSDLRRRRIVLLSGSACVSFIQRTHARGALIRGNADFDRSRALLSVRQTEGKSSCSELARLNSAVSRLRGIVCQARRKQGLIERRVHYDDAIAECTYRRRDAVVPVFPKYGDEAAGLGGALIQTQILHRQVGSGINREHCTIVRFGGIARVVLEQLVRRIGRDCKLELARRIRAVRPNDIERAI